MDDLVVDLDLGKKRGRPSKAEEPLLADVARPLREADLPLLVSPPKVEGPPALQKMRYTHHQLARLIAVGKSQVEAALLTGYTPEFVYRLTNQDEQFMRLVEYYAANEEQIFVDLLERAKALGLMAMEELQERLEAEPEGWTKQQLMDLAEMTAMKPAVALRAASRAGFNLNLQAGEARAGGGINITFVKPQEPKVVEGEVRDLPFEDLEK